MKILIAFAVAAGAAVFMHQAGLNKAKLECRASLDDMAAQSAEKVNQSKKAIYDIETARITAESAANARYMALYRERQGKPAVVACTQSAGRVSAILDPEYGRVLIEASRDPRLSEAPDSDNPIDPPVPTP